jgi:hypothetical protein
MSQTKLYDDVAFAHVFAISGKIVATQHPFEFRSQHLHENVRAARRRDLKQGVQAGAKTPRPPRLATLAMARLIHVQTGLQGKVCQQRFVRFVQRRTHFVDYFGQQAPRQRHAQHIADKVADRRIGRVAGAFEISDQRRQAWPHQAAALDPRRQGPVMNLAAVRTPGGLAAMFHDAERHRFDVDLLHGRKAVAQHL